jgi:uncharacterized membrane protein YdjX (TVP38/TMEM64 family)
MTRAARIRLSVVVAAVAALGVGMFFLPIQEPLRQLFEWARGLGPWGLVVLGAFYIPASVFLIPGSLVTLAAGALFGLGPGLVAISLGSTAGACAAFLIGRGLARPWVEKKVAGSPKFQAVDQAIAAQGFKIVLLLRLSPVFPFTLLNYFLALTRVRFRDYFLASWLGMFPGTVMYVYLGSTLANLAEVFSKDRPADVSQQVFFFVGLAVTVVATIYITRVARRALDQAIADARPKQPAPAGEAHA